MVNDVVEKADDPRGKRDGTDLQVTVLVDENVAGFLKATWHDQRCKRKRTRWKTHQITVDNASGVNVFEATLKQYIN